MKQRIFFYLVISLLVTSCQHRMLDLFKKGSYEFKKEVVELPFSLENGLIITAVEINGISYRFLVDTGAPNVISKELQSKFSFKKRRSFNTIDSQGNQSKLDYVKIPAIQMDQVIFKNSTAAIADLKFAEAIACLEIDGLMGSNLMRKAIWQIDYKHNVIRVSSDSKNLPIDSNSYEVPFSTNVSGTPIIQVILGNSTIKNIKFDTGSVGFLSISKEHYPTIKDAIKTERSSFGSASVGLFGKSEADTTQQVLIDTFKIGNLNLQNQIIDVRSSPHALLGTAFLKNFLVTINWKKRTLYLTPQDEFYNIYAEGFGLALSKEKDQLFVSMITSGSDAEKFGIKIGDKIVQVNEINVEETSLEEYCEIIRMVRMGEVRDLHLIIMRNGQPTDIHLPRLAPLKK